MSVRIYISVPNIATVIALYDQILVFRSTTGIGGPFVELTSDTPRAAQLTGTEVGPFNINGKTLAIQVRGGATQTVTFTGADPVAIGAVITEVTAGTSGIIASDDGGKLKLETDGTGTDETLKIIEGTALADLGFTVGQFDVGEAARIGLLEGVTSYLFTDVFGSADYYYQTQFRNSGSGDTSDTSDPIQGQLSSVLPEVQADSRSPRGLTLLRGATHTFRQSFYEDEAHCIPVVPLDSSRYPSYNIIDINGQIIASGIAQLDGSPGNYKVDFFVPQDAEISNDDRRWRVEFFMVSDRNRQMQVVQEFDVRDADVPEDPLELKLMALAGQPFRACIRLPYRPYHLSLQVTNATDSTDILLEEASYPTSPSGNVLTETIDDGTYVYCWELTGLEECHTYQSIWSVQKTASSGYDYMYQIIEVPPSAILQFFVSLRMVIDKFQKRRDMVQAYQDSDIYEYLTRGAEIVNAYSPVTSYSMTAMPPVLAPYWLMASAMWGLNAQHLLEVDIGFSFSGQTVTLEYDHASQLESAVQRALDFLENRLEKTKLALYRRGQRVGVVAGRPYRAGGIDNYVFPLQSVNSADYLGLLSKVGLL
jgi:hypothetical protein